MLNQQNLKYFVFVDLKKFQNKTPQFVREKIWKKQSKQVSLG